MGRDVSHGDRGEAGRGKQILRPRIQHLVHSALAAGLEPGWWRNFCFRAWDWVGGPALRSQGMTQTRSGEWEVEGQGDTVWWVRSVGRTCDTKYIGSFYAHVRWHQENSWLYETTVFSALCYFAADEPLRGSFSCNPISVCSHFCTLLLTFSISALHENYCFTDALQGCIPSNEMAENI